jgi:hypothetical protein
VKDPSGTVNGYRDIFFNAGSNVGWHKNTFEYQQKTALPGKYKISVSYYDRSSHPGRVPSIIRIRQFSNFGKPSQCIAIENIIMDNQYGEIEISEVKW